MQWFASNSKRTADIARAAYFAAKTQSAFAKNSVTLLGLADSANATADYMNWCPQRRKVNEEYETAMDNYDELADFSLEDLE